MPVRLLRNWLARHGTAVGVAVNGSDGFDKNPAGLANLLSRHERLQQWLADQDVPLSYDVGGLARVEGCMDGWRADPLIRPQLGNEIGTFLGSVIVATVSSAVWTVWPNGHPVVALTSGRKIDVAALAARSVASGAPSLASVLNPGLSSGADLWPC